MMMALIIVAMLLYIIFKASKSRKRRKNNNLLINLLVVAIILTLIQIVLGTQVRQFVDHQIDLHGEQAKNLWLQKPELQFYIHRSFSVLVVLLNLYIAFLIHKSNLGYKKINWVLILLLSEIISGITMYYMNFPFGSQTIHLVMASLLFGAQFYLVLEAINAKRSVKTL